MAGYDRENRRDKPEGLHPDSIANLDKAELVRVLSPESVARLEPLVHRHRFERRRVLYFDGSEADRLWIVQQGQVRLYKSSSRGQITTLDVLGPGEIFGALAAPRHSTYSTSAEAVTDGFAWWLPSETFQSVLENEPKAAIEVLRIISGRLRDAQDRLRVFAYDAAPARLAHALLLSSHEGEAAVTRRALAEMAGTTVETAIRVLRRFEGDGLVRGHVGCIEILDDTALRKIASSS